MARADGKNGKVSDAAMNNIRSVVREGLDVLDHNSDLFVGRELKGTWGERGMSFYRLTVEPENVSAGFLVFCRSEQRQAFKLVMCDSEANVLHAASSRKNCSEVVMHFTHFDTYTVPALRNTDVATATAIPGTSLLPEASSTAYQFSVPTDDCDTALGVFTALDGVKTEKRSIAPGKYLICVLSAAPPSSHPVRFTIAAFTAKGAKDPSAQAIAQADAEVFRQKEAMQELKAGYLKAKAEYLAWLHRAAEEETRVAALLEKRDRTYFTHVDSSLKASSLPVRPHVVYDQQGVAVATGTSAAATGAWGKIARQLSLGKNAIEAMMRSPASGRSSTASTPQQQHQAGKPPRPFSTNDLQSPSGANGSSAYTTPIKSTTTSAQATPASTGGKGKILARYIYTDEDDGAAAEPSGASSIAPTSTAAALKVAPVIEVEPIPAETAHVAVETEQAVDPAQFHAVSDEPQHALSALAEDVSADTPSQSPAPDAEPRAETEVPAAMSTAVVVEEECELSTSVDAAAATVQEEPSRAVAMQVDVEPAVSETEPAQPEVPEMGASAELSPTRSPKRVHWPEDSPVAGAADAPVSSLPAEEASAGSEQDSVAPAAEPVPMSSLARIFDRSASENNAQADQESATKQALAPITDAVAQVASAADTELEAEAEIPADVVTEPVVETETSASTHVALQQQVAAVVTPLASTEPAEVAPAEPDGVVEQAASAPSTEQPSETAINPAAEETPVTEGGSAAVAISQPAVAVVSEPIPTAAVPVPAEASLALEPPPSAAVADTSKSPKSPAAKKKRKGKSGKKKGSITAATSEEAATEEGAEEEVEASEIAESVPSTAEVGTAETPKAAADVVQPVAETPAVAMAEQAVLIDTPSVVLEPPSATPAAAAAPEMVEVEEEEDAAVCAALDDSLNTTADFEDALEGIVQPATMAWSAHPAAQDQTPVPMVWDLPPSIAAPTSPVPIAEVKPSAVPSAATEKVPAVEKGSVPKAPASISTTGSAAKKEESPAVVAAKTTVTTSAGSSKNGSGSSGDSGKAKPSLQEKAAMIAKSAAALDAFTASTKHATPSPAPAPVLATTTPVAAATGAQTAAARPISTQKPAKIPARTPAGPTATAAPKTGDTWGFPAAANTWDFVPSKATPAAEAPKSTPAPSVWGQPTPNLAPARAGSGSFPSPAPAAGNGQTRPVSSNGYGSVAPQQQNWQQTQYATNATRPGNGMGIASTGMGSAAHPATAPTANTVKANKKYLEMNDPFAGL